MLDFKVEVNFHFSYFRNIPLFLTLLTLCIFFLLQDSDNFKARNSTQRTLSRGHCREILTINNGYFGGIRSISEILSLHIHESAFRFYLTSTIYFINWSHSHGSSCHHQFCWLEAGPLHQHFITRLFIHHFKQRIQEKWSNFCAGEVAQWLRTFASQA